eukprot:CAMPEP_0183743866 /NCGR_PEP_ID=MMETSP0737-20130205/65438_1 /TAXON_ID=385413 /ORGANISM="Thalassiosira miniscula, Strain CCMP1093" /LENGTH=372 /DNA_ID=CAMNT_0025979495 /DNA_START=250 /DNA_END=1365 /DNA_ORIENTATION=+
MCMNTRGSSLERRHFPNGIAPLQISPASRLVDSSNSNSNFHDERFIAASMSNTNQPWTEVAMNRRLGIRPFKNIGSILLMMCGIASFLLLRYLVGILAAGPIIGDYIDNNKRFMLSQGIVDPEKVSEGACDNDFANQFRNASRSQHLNSDGFVPFILRDGKLLCRRIHRKQIGKEARVKSFAEMVKIGLKVYKHEHKVHKVRSELPLLLLNSDSSGCVIREQLDRVDFPRLTWAYPSPKHGTGWCRAIPVPSYVSWMRLRNDYKYFPTWKKVFSLQSRKYPWTSKLNKAVWRGTTTYDKSYRGVELNETPRGVLVQKSMEHHELIDAGFVELIQQYKARKDDLLNQTILAERMDFDNQMKYKAILDIDGNNW